MADYNLKRTGEQIDALLDKVDKEGNVAMVYNTSLDIFGIVNGSVVTDEQITEVSNIMDKWEKGYVVTYVDSRQNQFHYGPLSVCRSDDGVPITLSVIDANGDLLAYSYEPVGEATWTVTNNGGSTGDSVLYSFCTPTLLDFNRKENLTLNDEDKALIKKLEQANGLLKNAGINYCGIDGNGLQYVVPLSFYSDLHSIGEDFSASFGFVDDLGISWKFSMYSDGGIYVATPLAKLSCDSGGESKIYETDIFTPYYLTNVVNDGDTLTQADINEMKNILQKSREGYVIRSKYNENRDYADGSDYAIFNVSNGQGDNIGGEVLASIKISFIAEDLFIMCFYTDLTADVPTWDKKALNLNTLQKRGITQYGSFSSNAVNKSATWTWNGDGYIGEYVLFSGQINIIVNSVTYKLKYSTPIYLTGIPQINLSAFSDAGAVIGVHMKVTPNSKNILFTVLTNSVVSSISVESGSTMAARII